MKQVMFLLLLIVTCPSCYRRVLHPFYLVEESLMKAGSHSDEKNGGCIDSLLRLSEVNPDLGIFYTRARNAIDISDSFTTYIEDLKYLLINGNDSVSGYCNMSVPESILFNEPPPYRVDELRRRVEDTRKALVQSLKGLGLDTAINRIAVYSDLRVEDEEGHRWEELLFRDSPLAAVITMLTKIQNDAKNTLAEVLKVLHDAALKEQNRKK